MTDSVLERPPEAAPEGDGHWSSPAWRARLRRRYAAGRRFKVYGQLAIGFALLALATLFANMAATGYGAFARTEIRLDIDLDARTLDPNGSRDPAQIAKASYRTLIRNALRARFPEVTERRQRRQLAALLSRGAESAVRAYVLADPDAIGARRGIWLPADDAVDQVFRGRIDRDLPAASRKLSDRQLAWLDRLAADGMVRASFNTTFFTSGDSREPELAGVWGATLGSFFTLLVTFVVAFPLGVMAAVYLEEFAPANRFTRTIEININNLAAVPSIVFGLLGLAIFLNIMHLPRSAPLVGGLTLALMTLPTIILAGRSALKSVPPSIRDAGLALGASPMQVALHHTLPLAMPGILTGAIIGMARALGETAPLLMIGMVAFIVDPPGSPMEPASVLPVQVYLWADSPERAFVEKTAAATLVLLGFLVAMNLLAVVLRRRFERRY